MKSHGPRLPLTGFLVSLHRMVWGAEVKGHPSLDSLNSVGTHTSCLSGRISDLKRERCYAQPMDRGRRVVKADPNGGWVEAGRRGGVGGAGRYP